jgi:hypothetical protein
MEIQNHRSIAIKWTVVESFRAFTPYGRPHKRLDGVGLRNRALIKEPMKTADLVHAEQLPFHYTTALETISPLFVLGVAARLRAVESCSALS